jgi:hypothetical protein
MAKCQDCGKEMLDHLSCDFTKLSQSKSGKKYDRIKYGQGHELDYIAPATDPDYQYCHDCGVENGGYHHFGCDMEECPKCHQQLLGCECNFRYVIK